MARKKSKTYSQWIIPTLALLLIFLVVVLVGPPASLREALRAGPRLSLPSGFKQISKKEPAAEFPVQFSFSPESIYLKEGKAIEVDLIITPQREIRLDGVDIILTFDPEILEVTQVKPVKVFSTVSQTREKAGQVAITFLEEKSDGLLFKEGAKLLNLTIKGKKGGKSNLSVLSSDEGPTTVVIESETSRKIPFDSAGLAVVVY